MTLTDYYKFEKLPGTKSKTRIDCTASTNSYQGFEGMRNKAWQLFVHFGNVPERFKGGAMRKADKAITKVNNISSVFIPDVKVNTGYGDVNGTKDAILIVYNSDQTEFEIFVARGQKNNRLGLWQSFVAGDFNGEMESLRAKAVTESVTEAPGKENDKTAGNEK